MRTAVDSSVLLDVLVADAEFGPASREALRASVSSGPLLACEVVWAEVCAFFPSTQAFVAEMSRLGVEFSPISAEGSAAAGQFWREHRRKHQGRSRMIPDFLIGAHALAQADALLTRDRGFYREYYSGLRILDPTAGSS